MGDWRGDWSRHYDQVQWVVATILISAGSGLLAYMWSKPLDDFSIVVGVLGIWLFCLTGYYAASFRRMRHKLHQGMDAEEKGFLGKPSDELRLPQWPVFILTLVLLVGAWLWLFHKEDHTVPAIAAGGVLLAYFGFIYWYGRNCPTN